MKHIRKGDSAVCGSPLSADRDSLVVAALASDCDDCRVKLRIARTNDKSWDGHLIGVKPEPKFDPQPLDLEKTKKVGG